jgi:hypothetical protein
MIDQYYTLDDVAKIAKRSKRSLHRDIENNRLRASKVGNGHDWRVAESDLKSFLNGSHLSAYEIISDAIKNHADALTAEQRMNLIVALSGGEFSC